MYTHIMYTHGLIIPLKWGFFTDLPLVFRARTEEIIQRFFLNFSGSPLIPHGQMLESKTLAGEVCTLDYSVKHHAVAQLHKDVSENVV